MESKSQKLGGSSTKRAAALFGKLQHPTMPTIFNPGKRLSGCRAVTAFVGSDFQHQSRTQEMGESAVGRDCRRLS